jgi:tetratricopeptide (TPR) repeat protein
VILNRLGNLYQAKENLPAAERVYRQALEIDQAALGKPHQALARDWNNLGVVFEKMGDLPAATKAYRRALDNLEGLLPEDHPFLHGMQQNLARLAKGG